jgi:GntR family transcriptional regulator
MQFHLNPSDGMPIYKQIINQVKHMIGAGRLQPADEMPSVRVLARQLLVNPNTVSRSYRDLEAMGLLVSRQGSGTFVTAAGSPLASREKLRLITERADALLVEAQQLGFSLAHVKQLLDKRHAELSAIGKKTA